jgi:hypothetical protein
MSRSGRICSRRPRWPLETLDGHARQYLISYLGNRDGHPTHRCAARRMTRRVW